MRGDRGAEAGAHLGGRHLNDLAGAALDDHEATLAEGRALLGVRGGRSGISLGELDLLVEINLGVGGRGRRGRHLLVIGLGLRHGDLSLLDGHRGVTDGKWQRLGVACARDNRTGREATRVHFEIWRRTWKPDADKR